MICCRGRLICCLNNDISVCVCMATDRPLAGSANRRYVSSHAISLLSKWGDHIRKQESINFLFFMFVPIRSWYVWHVRIFRCDNLTTLRKPRVPCKSWSWRLALRLTVVWTSCHNWSSILLGLEVLFFGYHVQSLGWWYKQSKNTCTGGFPQGNLYKPIYNEPFRWTRLCYFSQLDCKQFASCL